MTVEWFVSCLLALSPKMIQELCVYERTPDLVFISKHAVDDYYITSSCTHCTLWLPVEHWALWLLIFVLMVKDFAVEFLSIRPGVSHFTNMETLRKFIITWFGLALHQKPKTQTIPVLLKNHRHLRIGSQYLPHLLIRFLLGITCTIQLCSGLVM